MSSVREERRSTTSVAETTVAPVIESSEAFLAELGDFSHVRAPFEEKSTPLKFELGYGLARASDYPGSEKPLVLLTGGTGFIGSHTANLLMHLGYRVRCTVRDESSQYAQWLLSLNEQHASGSLTLINCCLESLDNWPEALRGVDTVIHCASQTRKSSISKCHVESAAKFKSSLTGLIKILELCAAEKIRRFILVSSLTAMDEDCLSATDGSRKQHKVDLLKSSESMWTPPDKAKKLGAHPYVMAKTFMEMAFWKWWRAHSMPFEAVSILPSLTLGPSLTGRVASSYDALLFFTTTNLPTAKIEFALVDVRDVAFSLVSAMQKKSELVDGSRYLVTAGVAPALACSQYYYDYCHRKDRKRFASEWSIKSMPDIVGWLACYVQPDFKEGVWPQWNAFRYLDNRRSQRDLGLVYMTFEQMYEDTLDSLFEKGVMPEPQNRALLSPSMLKFMALVMFGMGLNSLQSKL